MRKLLVVTMFWLLALEACHKTPSVPLLALEECDPAGYVTCIPQEAFASIPVVDTGAYLTYSSRWVAASPGQRAWDANGLGIGGWSINFVQRYDKANRLFMSGDGSWHVVDSVALPSSQQAVPSYDGTVAYIFDSVGRHVRTVDARLGTELVKITYDSAGRLAKLDGAINDQPIHISLQRDANGRAQALVGTDGGTTTLGLDGNSRLASVTDPAGETTRIVWDASGRVESETDPAGGVVQFTYDSSGRLASATDADGVTQKFDYKTQSDAFEIHVSTSLGRHWSYRTESTRDGIRRTYTATDGTITTETTNATGNRLLKLADGTSYKIGTLPNPIWGMASPILTPIVETRADGVTSDREIKYALRPQNGAPYSVVGSITTTVNGQNWVQTFDPSQRSITLVDPAGRRTTTQYDAQRRRTSYSAPGVAPIAYTYNEESRLTSATVGTGQNASTTHYAYNANTGEVVTSRPDGIVLKTAVDQAGQPVCSTAGDGSTILAGNDSGGRLMQIQPPGGFNYTLGSSPAGRDTGFAPPIVEGDGSVETTAYDKDGQVAAVSGPGKRAINYAYDSAGRVISSTFDQGQSTVSYDAHSGLRNQASDPGGVITSYGYVGSTLNRLAWSGPVSGSVSATLDSDGRQAREDVNGSNSFNFAYDPAGNLIGVGPLSLTRDANTGLVTRSTLGIVETKQEFDSNGWLRRSTANVGAKVLLDQLYTRDTLGRIKTIADTEADGKTSTTEYSYDRADRLALIRVNGRAIETENYDATGNRVGVVRASKKTTAKYDAREELLNWGLSQYSWAPDGHLSKRTESKGSDSFDYDDFGSLRAATLVNGTAIKYYVDADGRRVGRAVGGKLVAQYLYRPDGAIAAELDSGGNLVSRFGYDELGHLAIVERGGVTYRVITDPIGSPRLIVDSRSGTVADEITYDTWGNLTRETAPVFIPIGFAGGLRDSGTGLVHFGARDYDPMVGRWTAADPIRFSGGDVNLYRYVQDNPVNLTDSAGLDSGGYFESPFVTWPGEDRLPGDLNPYTTYVPPQPEPFVPLTPLTPLIPSYNPPPSPPANHGNPPGNGTQKGSPPPNQSGNSGNWSCAGVLCGGGNMGGGKYNYGCRWGWCSNGPNGFSCHAVFCQGPNWDRCEWCSMGDTHLWPAGATHFDFQGAGEFLVLSDVGGSVVVQARQQPSSSGTEVTFNTAVAANVNGDRIGVYAREPSFLVINGVPADQADVVRKLQHGGTLERHGSLVRVSWPNGSRLTVNRIADILSYYFSESPSVTAPMSGLLGNAGHNGSELVGRDGVALSRSDSEFQNKLYRQFGNSWRIKQPESLFHYWPGESTSTFTKLKIPSKTVTAASLSSDVHSKAEGVCRAFGIQSQPVLDDCILDVGVTGTPAFAIATAAMAANLSNSNLSLASAAKPASASPDSVNSPNLVTDQYAINIGDSVSPDHPSAGAGTIRAAGGKQTYLFPASAGQIIYFRASNCEGALVDFEIRKPSNDSTGFGRGNCGDLGPITLPTTGTYKILAKTDRGGARYSFSLRPTTFENYSIKIGDTVSPDHPSPGAGVIAQPGEQQSYSFPAKAGQIIYFSATNCEGAPVGFELQKPSNDSTGFGRGDCGDLGPVTLATAGMYKVLVKVDHGATARYSFSVRPTSFEQYSIKIGDTVSPDHPSRGAGMIAQPGEQQAYSFQGQAGQIIYFSASACEGVTVFFDFFNQAGGGVGGMAGCGNLGPITLATAGTYKILVKADHGGAARYSFKISGQPFSRR